MQTIIFIFHREKLCSHLPARAEGYSWSLVFSTSQHGFSLNSLYRKMHKLESPILIVIEDTEKNVSRNDLKCREEKLMKFSIQKKNISKFVRKSFLKFCFEILWKNLLSFYNNTFKIAYKILKLNIKKAFELS